MKYLSGEEVLIIHSEIIDKTGGLHGVRDVGLLISIIEKPKGGFAGKQFYKGIFEKAAAYSVSFAKYHVFVDGNKRIAFAASIRFLFLNGYDFIATNEAIEKFVLRIVEEDLNTTDVAEWLKSKTKRADRGRHSVYKT